MDVAGKTAIVTGGGSGIGRATALRLAGGGANVLVVDVDEAKGKAVAAEMGARGAVFRADATQDNELRGAFDEAARRWVGVDIVFNNAGILTGVPIFPETPPEQWARVLEINLRAVIRGTQLGIEALRRRGGGVIVNTASMAGLNAWATDPVYSATKGGVVLFTKALAGLASTDRIRVNCVCPTLVDTPLVRDAADERVSDLIRVTNLKPDDVAAAVMRLIEDESMAGVALRVLPGQEPSPA